MAGFGAAVLVMGLTIVLIGGVYVLARSVQVSPPQIGVEPFLSGLPPVEHAASRYHLRWYPVTLLFLAFDMEMVVMFPWTRVVAEVGTPAVVEMFTFLLILLAGVGYAWREGALRWT